jgi:protein-tyrosine phosphatase
VKSPFPGCFWVGEGRLLAGCYPHGRIEELRDAGVESIVDLTEEGELEPYDCSGMHYTRLPIRDFSVPTTAEMEKILDAIDAELAGDRIVYVHCRGGVGRTGTVIGCHLIRRGASPDEALDAIHERSGRRMPETREQFALIRAWRGRGHGRT